MLRAEPAPSLVAPGATLIREVGAERFQNITGWEAAFFGHVSGTQSPPDDVFNFYERELTKLSWKPDARPIPSSGELDGWAWCKPQLIFRLAIFDPQEYDRVGIRDGTQYRAVFDARLQGTVQATVQACPRVGAPR